MKAIFKDKKKKAAFFLGISFIAAGASFAIPSLAWLAKAQTTAKLDGLEGEAHGSYFNGGDGSKDHPFEIDNARQLYYFNWLQDLGYFNAPNDDKSGIDQTYFILTSDIDASDYVLPPAGTEEYPFVGNFDGNSKTISGVTITNNYSELKNPPVGAKADSNGILNQAEIVGFFGVVGCTDDSGTVNTYTYDSSVLEIKNLGINKASIISASSQTLVGLAAGYVNGTLSGVGIDTSSIATKEGASAITDIKGIKTISDYSLIGYATEAYRATTQINDETMSMPQIENPNTEHGSINWGGSVDMKQMYTNLKNEQSNIMEDVYYASSVTFDVDPNGNESKPYNISSSSTRASRTESRSYEYYFKNGERKDGDDVVASYGITTCSTYDNDYVFIYGTPDTTPTGSGTMSVTRNYYGYLTSISKSGNYLSITSDLAITNVTDSSLATSWTVPNDGSSDYLSTEINGTFYYLNLSETKTLSLSTTKQTSWVYSASKGNLYAINDLNVYYLNYDSSSGWGLLEEELSDSFLTIKDTTSNMYIGYSSSTASAKASSTVEDTTYAWGYNSSKGGYYPLTDSTVFLSAKKTREKEQNTWTISFASEEQSGGTAIGFYKLSNASSDGTGSGGTMQVSIKGGKNTYTAYLYYGSSSFLTDTSTSNHKFTVSQVGGGGEEVNVGLSLAKTDKTIKKDVVTSNEARAYYVNPTYIPLAYSYNDLDNKTGINGVSNMNTGYLVGGANYINSSDYAGDIRVAKAYTMSSLSTSFDSIYQSNYLHVLTHSPIKNKDTGAYSDGGWSYIKDTYNSGITPSSSISSKFTNPLESTELQRYTNARKNLQYTLFGDYDKEAEGSSSDSLYGIHFMDATISTDHVCEVGKAIVYDKEAEADYQAKLKQYLNGDLAEKPAQQGSEYKNYEVPEDSIDFNLATEGYINFFGGSYFNNNKSFFSLHQVIRYEDKQQSNYKKIKEIKEISKIYANTGSDKEDTPYVYSYSDGTTSGTIPSSSYLAFDTSWITSPTIVQNCLYYFEIPVNAGEYALGSVPDSNGAYILYLDIGTAAADYDNVVIQETTTSKIIKESYPKGVDFTSSFDDLPSLTGGGSACVAILVAPAKKIDYNYEGTTLTAGPVSGLKVVFQNESVTVSGSDGTIESKISKPIIVTMKRKTIQTFSPSNYVVSLDYSCTWSISGASADDQIQLYFPVTAEAWTSSDTSKGTVDTKGLVTIKATGDFEVTATGASEEQSTVDWKGPDPISTATEVVFGELKLSLTGGTASVEYVYDEDNKTYVVTVHSDVDVTATVLAIPSDSSYKITVNGTEVTAVNQTIEIPVSSS